MKSLGHCLPLCLHMVINIWKNSTTLDICAKVWLSTTIEVPSQAVTASVLDCVESEIFRLEEVTSFKIFTNGLGTKRRKV